MKRFTDTDLWDKEWFMSLPPEGKLLFKFICSKCDCAGVWTPNYTLASMYIGAKVTKDSFSAISEQIEFMPDGKIFIVDFIDFQYGKLTETCMPHRKIIATLKKHGIYERVLIGYRKGIDTLEEKEEEKDMDKEEDNKSETKNFQAFDVPVLAVPHAPKLDKVIEYFYGQGIHDPKEAERFFNHFQGLGWRKGISPIYVWQSFANNWISNKDQFTGGKNNSGEQVKKMVL